MSQVLWKVRLLDLEAGIATERRALTIDNGRISAIDDAAGELPPEARDFDGATVLPGLIDAHCHVLSSTERSPGFGPPPLLHGEAPRPAALGHYILAAAGKRIVRSGFTTVRDVGSHDDEASALKLAVDLGIVPGPRILTCGRIVSATAPGGVIFGSMYREADGPWEMRKAVREQIRRGADYIKFMATGARSVLGEDPEPAQMTLEEMTAIVDEAHRMGRRVAAHAEGLAGTRWAIEAGADTIEHGLSLHRAPDLLDAMRRAARSSFRRSQRSTTWPSASRPTSRRHWWSRRSGSSMSPSGRSSPLALPASFSPSATTAGRPAHRRTSCFASRRPAFPRPRLSERQPLVGRPHWAVRISGESPSARRPTWWSSTVDRTLTSASSRNPHRSSR